MGLQDGNTYLYNKGRKTDVDHEGQDKWSTLRPDFISSKASIREALGVPNGFRTCSTSNFLTGMAGLLMAAMLCDDGFDVYGFDTGDEPAGTPYHFYNNTQVSSNDNFGASKALLNDMAAAQPSCIRLQGGSEGD